MTIPYYDLTGKTEAEKSEILKREAGRKVTYITPGGERVEAVAEPPRGPLKTVSPHPLLGVEVMRSDSEQCKFTVANELGGKLPETEEQYREVLTHIAREKGWAIQWVDPEPPPAPEPPKKKRGRPKGSKNKPKPSA